MEIESVSPRVYCKREKTWSMLYSRGIFIHRAFEELNAREPGLVLSIHQEYLAAGAEILETNTYAANRFRLSPHGLSSRVEELNVRGVELEAS